MKKNFNQTLRAAILLLSMGIAFVTRAQAQGGKLDTTYFTNDTITVLDTFVNVFMDYGNEDINTNDTSPRARAIIDSVLASGSTISSLSMCTNTTIVPNIAVIGNVVGNSNISIGKLTPLNNGKGKPKTITDLTTNEYMITSNTDGGITGSIWGNVSPPATSNSTNMLAVILPATTNPTPYTISYTLPSLSTQYDLAFSTYAVDLNPSTNSNNNFTVVPSYSFDNGVTAISLPSVSLSNLQASPLDSVVSTTNSSGWTLITGTITIPPGTTSLTVTFTINSLMGNNTIGFSAVDLIGTLSSSSTTSSTLSSDICSITVLPITLQNFTAQVQNNAALLQWTTATEVGNKGFFVERSADGATWEDVTFIGSEASNNGNSSVPLYYKYIDEAPLAGTSYYRLKQEDLNNTVAFSGDQMVTFGLLRPRVYPVPASSQVTVILPVGVTGVHYRLINVNGVTVQSGTITNNGDYGKIPVSGVASGMYFLQLTAANNAIQTYKIVVQH